MDAAISNANQILEEIDATLAEQSRLSASGKAECGSRTATGGMQVLRNEEPTRRRSRKGKP